MKNTTVIFFSICFFIKTGYSQQLDWKQTENWKIYDIVGREAIKITIDSLKLLKGTPVSMDSVLYYLSEAAIWPSTKKAVWMGAYTLTYQLDSNQTRKLLVSTYGGFIFDSHSKQYYEIDYEKRDAWQAFLLSHLNKEN